MDARRLFLLGTTLAILGVVIGLVNGGLSLADPFVWPQSPEAAAVRLAANLGGILGFAGLALALHAVLGARMVPTFTAGLALFLIGRLGNTLLGLAIQGGRGGANVGLDVMFTLLGTLSGLGTVLVLIGLFQEARTRLEGAPPPPPKPAPAAAPLSMSITPGQPAPTQRRSSIRPAQAPMPPPKWSPPDATRRD